MERQEIEQVLAAYRKALLEDVIPFWTRHSLDREHGGFFSCLDRAGRVVSTDKYIWPQGRQAYTYSALYNFIEKRQEWLDIAAATVAFLEKHAFDESGRCHFHLTREGKVVEGPISLFSDLFGVYAFAEYGIAAQSDRHLSRARELFLATDERLNDPRHVPLYPFVEAHRLKHHAVAMMQLEMGQTIGRADPDPRVRRIVDQSLDRILNHHTRRQEKVLLETLGPNLEPLDTAAGKVFNPGHAIESAWFVMHQGLQRKDQGMISQAAEIVEWSMEKCWDREHGGMISLLTSDGSEPEPPDWFKATGLDRYAKVWWVHTEGLYGTLLGHLLTGKESLAEWWRKVHDFSFRHFPDVQYGEWYAALRRDGTPARTEKGDMWKSMFHLARALLLAVHRLEEAQKRVG